MSLYNPTRHDEQLLSQFSSSPPSFTINFYPDHWLINNSRPHLYHTPIAFLLDDIRQRRIPPDWLQTFDQNGVAFYDGCLIIELVDHRTVNEGEVPTKERVVLPLDSESLWNDIRSEPGRSGKQMTDEEALDLESRILAATSPPLCLDPDVLVSRIANTALRSSSQLAPNAFRKKDAAAESERNGAIKAREDKIMSLMNPHSGRITHASSKIFELVKKSQAMRHGHPHQTTAFQPAPPQPPPAQTAVGDKPLAPIQPPNAAPIPPASHALAQAQAQAQAAAAKKKGKSLKVEDAPTPMPPPPQTPDHESLGSGKIKRKASLTAPTPPPAMKRMMMGNRQSESVEPSPAATQASLPPATPQQVPQIVQPPSVSQQPNAQVQQQQVAYQLTPSTSAAMPFGQQAQNKRIMYTLQQRMAQAAAAANGQGTSSQLPDQLGQSASQMQHMPQQVAPQSQAASNPQVQAAMQMAPSAAQAHGSPIQRPPSHPVQSKPATPQPNAAAIQQAQQQQHAQQLLHAQQQQQQQPIVSVNGHPLLPPNHPQYASQIQILAAANPGNPNLVAAAAAVHYQQQQQHLQAQNAAAARAAIASPRPPQPQQPQANGQISQQTTGSSGTQFPQGAFTFNMPSGLHLQQRFQHARAQAGLQNLMASNNGQLPPHLQMAAMMAQQGQNALQQQQAHANSPQVAHRSPHPGSAQAPSRPGSVMPQQQNAAAIAQAQAQYNQNQIITQAQRQHQLQLQQQQQQVAAQMGMGMMPGQNFPAHLQGGAGGQNNPAAAAAAAMMMNGQNPQFRLSSMTPQQQQQMQAHRAQYLLQQQAQMNAMALGLQGMRNGVPGPNQGR